MAPTEPVDELGGLSVAPHPRGKPRERGAALRLRALAPGVAVEHRGIRPVGLERHHAEAALLDQLARDPGAQPVEVAGPVRRLADQHDARGTDARQQPPEVRGLDVLERLAGHRDRAGGHLGPGVGAARAALASHRHGRLRRPSLRADERHEAHGAERLALQAPVQPADDAHQLLPLRVAPDRDHQPTARRQLREQARRHVGPAGRDHDRVEGRTRRDPDRTVALQHRDVAEP